MGGDAVKNSKGVSICGDFFGGGLKFKSGSGQNEPLAF